MRNRKIEFGVFVVLAAAVVCAACYVAAATSEPPSQPPPSPYRPAAAPGQSGPVYSPFAVSPPGQPGPAYSPFAAAPLLGRWQIVRAEMAADRGDGDANRSSVNTILLDTATGETWLLWPTGKGETRHYAWIPLPKEKLPPVTDVAPESK